MIRENMFAQFTVLQGLTDDHDQWLQHPYGIDLWVDGLNVFLTVDHEDFERALDQFLHHYPFPAGSMTGCLQALQDFCRDSAKVGEFELYQALSVGMTWLSLHMEMKNPFFNTSLEITDHSLALLLSPTYLALYVYSYNAGIELYSDLNQNGTKLFRPEHGRIYEEGFEHQKYANNFLFTSYAHEMAHIYFFHDLYARTVGDDALENASFFVLLEALCCYIGDNILHELVNVRDDLTAIETGYYALLPISFDAGIEQVRVHKGEIPGVTGRDLSVYLCKQMQLGEGDRHLPDNRFKLAILENFSLSAEQERQIAGMHFGHYASRMARHAPWGLAAGRRNRITWFKEVVDLMPPDPLCQRKLPLTLDPYHWDSPVKIFDGEALPELDPNLRRKNKQLWRWRELFYRIAETRGHLQEIAGTAESQAAQELLASAQQVVSMIARLGEVVDMEEENEERLRSDILDSVHVTLSRLTQFETYPQMMRMWSEPYAYLMEPS